MPEPGTLDEAGVRAKVRDFLADHDPDGADRLEFLRARFDAGLAWVHFPPGLGGLGLPRALQQAVAEEFGRVGASDEEPRRIGIVMAIAEPTIIRKGNAEQ